MLLSPKRGNYKNKGLKLKSVPVFLGGENMSDDRIRGFLSNEWWKKILLLVVLFSSLFDASACNTEKNKPATGEVKSEHQAENKRGLQNAVNSFSSENTSQQNLPGQQPLQIIIKEIDGKKMADNGYVTYEITGDPVKDEAAYKAAKEQLLKTNPEKYREMILREPVVQGETSKTQPAAK